MTVIEKRELLKRACRSLGFNVVNKTISSPSEEAGEDRWWLETGDVNPNDRCLVWFDCEIAFSSLEDLFRKFLEVKRFWFSSEYTLADMIRQITGKKKKKEMFNPFYGLTEEELAVKLDLTAREVPWESALD